MAADVPVRLVGVGLTYWIPMRRRFGTNRIPIRRSPSLAHHIP